MGADTPEIAVGTVEGGLYVGLAGRATQRTCPTVDQLVKDYFSSRPEKPLIVLDLAGCDWVDSTFAGWLVGVSKRMQRMAGGRLCATGCSERCRGSLDKMGLGELLRFESVPAPTQTRTIPCATGDRPSKNELTLMLEAHEALAALSPENERVFAPIVATLRSQIDHA
jgi:anti-anti-sigma regulatory factor